jgi:endonuclease YncB( thermonuclease family)
MRFFGRRGLRIGWLALWVAFAAAASPEASAGEWVRVKRINDGDTVQLEDGRLVRYIGVDSPEIDHERRTAEPFGFEARRMNAELVGSRRVRIEYDLERTDPHGRALAYVFMADGRMVNALLVEAGLAVCYYRYPNVRHHDRLLEAQRGAMQARRGIWGAEYGQRSGPGSASTFVGNRNSRRFHRPDCAEVKRIRPQNRIGFPSRWEAFWAGYSPSRECLAAGTGPPPAGAAAP